MDKGTETFRQLVWGTLEERNLSQNRFALEAECTPQSLCRWLSGKYSPTIREVSRMTEAFGFHIEIVPNEGGNK